MRALFLFLLVTTTVSFGQIRDNPYGITPDSVDHALPVPTVKRFITAGLSLPLFRQSTFTPTWKTIGLNATFQQKLLGGLAVMGGLETDFGFTGGGQLYTVEAPIGFRYYFPVGKRLKRRADRHSFFSPYLAFQTYNVLFSNLQYSNDMGSGSVRTAANYYKGQLLTSRTNLGNLNEAFNFMQYAYFQIGWQVKIARTNYLDVSTVIPIPGLIYHKAGNTLATPPIILIKYGVAWPQ